MGTPVIIVPGLMGSELWAAGSDAAINRIWLNPTALAFRWPWLNLAPDGTSPLPGNSPLVPRVMLWSYYGPLAQQLVALGWDVDAQFYDWRQSLSNAAGLLVARILKTYRTVPVHLVCHSMGGLVARLACATLAAQGKLGAVGRIVSLGTPHWGSWAAGGGLACAYWPTEQLLELLSKLGLFGLGLASQRILSSVACTWPGLYQLLPSPLAPGITLPEAIALYDEQTWQDQHVPVSSTWMAGAFNGWQAFPGLPSGVPWLSVAGTGFDTPSGPGLGGISAEPATCPSTTLGDGVVTSRYSYYGPEPVLYLFLAHDALAQSSRAVAAADTWLRGGTPEGIGAGAARPQPTTAWPAEAIQAAMRARASSHAQRTSILSSEVMVRPRMYRS